MTKHNIRRFDLNTPVLGKHTWQALIPSDDGDWVLFHDVETEFDRSVRIAFDAEVLRNELNLAQAEILRLRSVLTDMANDGCGLNSCLEQHPNDESEWCWSCMAKRALSICLCGVGVK